MVQARIALLLSSRRSRRTSTPMGSRVRLGTRLATDGFLRGAVPHPACWMEGENVTARGRHGFLEETPRISRPPHMPKLSQETSGSEVDCLGCVQASRCERGCTIGGGEP